MRLYLILTAYVSISHHACADGTEFVGNLVLLPDGCEQTGLCTLGEDFGFVDSQGIGWQASRGNTTDGASIPPWAQPFVGAPFEKAYIRAAVVHDHYCDRHVRSWKATHRVFYDALMASGVSSRLANVLFGAVYLGGPRWRETVSGVGCPVGYMCVADTTRKPPPPGTDVYLTEQNKPVIVRPAQYNSPLFVSQFDQLAQFINSQPDDLSPEAIAEAADQIFQDELFRTENVYAPGIFEQ